MKRLARSPAASLRRRPSSPSSGGGASRCRSSTAAAPAAWRGPLADESLTEVTAGSGFLDSHLFDGYRGLALEPAAFFALQVTRRPGPGFVHLPGRRLHRVGGAGPGSPARAVPARGAARSRGLEGAGEVQTPLVVPEGVARRSRARPSSSGTRRPESWPSTSRATCWSAATASRRGCRRTAARGSAFTESLFYCAVPARAG